MTNFWARITVLYNKEPHEIMEAAADLQKLLDKVDAALLDYAGKELNIASVIITPYNPGDHRE